MLRRLALLVATLPVVAPLASRALHAQGLRLSGAQPLSFGTVSPNRTATVAPASTDAARFTVQGPANASLVLTLTLPAVLARSGQLVAPSAWSGTVAVGAAGTPVAFAPVTGADLPVTLGADGLAVVRLGATIAPAMTVGSGSFTGTITLVAREPATGRLSLTAQVAVTASLLQPLVLGTLPLHFPRVYSGTPATIAPEALTALRVTIDGALASQVDVTLDALPGALTRVGGGGTLPIGTWRQRAGANCTGGALAVTSGATTTLTLADAIGSAGRTAICLGAAVTPAVAQPAGTYQGTVTVSVRYTGA
jgi:hypothetical protein